MCQFDYFTCPVEVRIQQPLSKLRESLPSFCCLEMLLFHTSLHTISSSSQGNKCPEITSTVCFFFSTTARAKHSLRHAHQRRSTNSHHIHCQDFFITQYKWWVVRLCSQTERTLNHPRSTLITTRTAMGLLGNQNPKIKIPVFLYFLSSWVLRRLLFGCIRCKFTPSSLRCFHPWSLHLAASSQVASNVLSK
jgi:hypothetical protein